MEKLDGIILKGIGGFYYVEASNYKIYECKARGVFRKDSLTPLVGDRVIISTKYDGYASIDNIKTRKNYFVRPAVANVDRMFIVISTCDPLPNTLIIDKMIAIANYKGIDPVLVFTKVDIQDCRELIEVYMSAGVKYIEVSSKTKKGIDSVKELLKHGVNVFTGNSGVGKSSLLNCILPSLKLMTGETSKKLGRGKHTTRHAELFKIDNSTYIVDTPGFSMIDLQKSETIAKEELASCFAEFNDYISDCKFKSCTHTCEKGCSVLRAVEEGKIHKSRHQNYIAMYNEVKDIKDWQRRKD